jgi:hypothetical protein
MGHVEDLVREGGKHDIDDDDAPFHSILGIKGTTSIHGHQNQVITTRGTGRAESYEYRTFLHSLCIVITHV